MILIADSGSTKTDWCVVEQGQLVRQVFTKGINPFFQTKEEIGEEIRKSLLPHLDCTAFESVYFYGAGCTPEKSSLLEQELRNHLQIGGTIEVNSDMLGASRALCGKQPGIVCILGTGSNSCFYDGEKIAIQVPSLGFILGDEGGGATLGKLLVSDLLKNQLGIRLKEKFLTQYNLTLPEIIENVYRKPFPNRFLAGFSPFIYENLEEPEIHTLALNAFKSFFERNVTQYDHENHPVNLAGSIAYHYRKILAEAAKEFQIEIRSVVQSPMQGLIRFHQLKIES